MATHILEIEDIKKDGIVETSIARSSGKTRKALIVRTDVTTKEVSFVVLNNKEEKILDLIDDAVNYYNSIE